MFRKVILPLLAAAGVVFAIYTVRAGSKAVPASQPVAEPPRAPFAAYVAGAGLVEASTENIAVGTPVAGVVEEVLVKVGDRIETGAPLFKLDDRDLRAELAVRQAAVMSAERQLQKLQQQPRPEELPVAEAKVQEAEAQLAHDKQLLARWEQIKESSAVNQEEVIDRRMKMNVSAAALAEAKANLALINAGAWEADQKIAQAALDAAKAQVQSIQTDIDRRTIKALVAGRVLKVNVRPGEFAPIGMLPSPLMLIGQTDVLHVRVDVDENEASRVRPGAAAAAFVRGNSETRIPLEFVRIEPYVVPKKSLTGDSNERVDTRVLQAIYRYRPETTSFPTYVGQQMDVYIEVPSPGVAGPTTRS